MILPDYMSQCFQRLVKTFYLWLDFFKACQSVLIRRIRFLTFSFISTTFLDVSDKSRYQHNTSYSTYFSIDHWLRLSWQMLTYKNLANRGLSQGNPSSKLIWLEISRLDKIQFPAHHKISEKTSKNQSIRTKKFNLILRGESYLGPMPWPRPNAATRQGLTNVTGVISKLIRVKFKTWQGTIIDSIFSPG